MPKISAWPGRLFFLSGALFLFSCQPKGIRPPPPEPGAQPLAKTLGDVAIQSASGFSVTYKTLLLSINSLPASSTPADYFLFSKSAAIPSLTGVRPSQKIIAPPESLSRLKSQGFTFVKDIAAGRMIQLTKEGSFLFVRAADVTGTGGGTIKSYFLEFDNGRNLLFVADGVRADDLRTFLYALRDEGKEIHMVLIPGSASADAADIIGLFQPHQAVVVDLARESRGDLSVKLKDQFFQGALIFAQSGETIPF